MIIFAPVNATIAQSVEHFIRNEKVASSSLACGSSIERKAFPGYPGKAFFNIIWIKVLTPPYFRNGPDRLSGPKQPHANNASPTAQTSNLHQRFRILPSISATPSGKTVSPATILRTKNRDTPTATVAPPSDRHSHGDRKTAIILSKPSSILYTLSLCCTEPFFLFKERTKEATQQLSSHQARLNGRGARRKAKPNFPDSFANPGVSALLGLWAGDFPASALRYYLHEARRCESPDPSSKGKDRFRMRQHP